MHPAGEHPAGEVQSIPDRSAKTGPFERMRGGFVLHESERSEQGSAT